MAWVVHFLLAILSVSIALAYLSYGQRRQGLQELRLKILQTSLQQVQDEIQRHHSTVMDATAQHQRSLQGILDLIKILEGWQSRDNHTLQALQTQHEELTQMSLASSIRARYNETYHLVRKQLEVELQRLQNPTDCSSARYLACSIINRQCGFACQLHTLSDCMISAFLSQRTAVLLPPQLMMYGFECNSLWDCFFLPLSPCNDFAGNISESYWANWTQDSIEQFTIYTSWGEDPYRVPAFVTLLLSNPIFQQLQYTPPPTCLMVGVLLKWALRPNARVWAAIEQRRQMLQLQSKPPDVGVHIRHTDKVSDKFKEALAYDLRYYMMHVDHFVAPTTYHHAAYGKKYGKQVLIVSDFNVTNETLEFSAYNFTLATSDSHHNPLQIRWSMHALDILICDIFSLVETPYFVGTLSSQVAQVVVELRAASAIGAESFLKLASLDAGYYKGRQVAPGLSPFPFTPHLNDYYRAWLEGQKAAHHKKSQRTKRSMPGLNRSSAQHAIIA